MTPAFESPHLGRTSCEGFVTELLPSIVKVQRPRCAHSTVIIMIRWGVQLVGRVNRRASTCQVREGRGALPVIQWERLIPRDVSIEVFGMPSRSPAPRNRHRMPLYLSPSAERNERSPNCASLFLIDARITGETVLLWENYTAGAIGGVEAVEGVLEGCTRGNGQTSASRS